MRGRSSLLDHVDSKFPTSVSGVINTEGNSLVRHTTVSLGYKAAGLAILSTAVAVVLTISATGSGITSAATSARNAPGAEQLSATSVVAHGALGVHSPKHTTAARPAATAVTPVTPLEGSGSTAVENDSVAIQGILSGKSTGTVLSTAPQNNVLTPGLVGLLSRSGVPPSAYRAAEGGYDVQGTHDDQGNNDGGDVSWAELQPVAGGPIAPDNAIDQAITDVDAWNAANPTHPELLKVRIVAGIHSPTWADNLGGACYEVTDPNSGESGCSPRFWTQAFSDAYYQFEAELAAKYDGNPAIGEVLMAKNATVYNESLIRQTESPATVTAMLAAGYTTTVDEQEQILDIESLGTYWLHTHVGFAFNPYQTVNPVAEDEAFTQELIADGRQVLGDQLVIENNSLRQSYLGGSGSYQSMYAFMDQVGGPIAFQTSTIGRAGSLAAVLDGAVALSASSVELPSGYEADLTPAQVAAISADLA
jgi:hypothetical protein